MSTRTLDTTAVATGLALTVLFGAVAFAVAAGEVDDGSAVVIALVLLDGLVACALGWWSARRAGLGRLGWTAPVLAIALVLATLRHVEVSTIWLAATGAVWVVQPLGVIVVLAAATGSTRVAPRWLPATVLAAAVAAATLGGEAGPGAPTDATGGPWNPEHPLASSVPPAARAFLAIASIGGLVVAVLLVRRLRQAGASTAVVVATIVWTLALLVERVVHLLPVGWYRETMVGDSTGGYRAWAAVVGVNLPLLATGAVLAVLLDALVIGPRFRRLPDGALVAVARPTGDLVDTLASWTGDPSLTVVDAWTAPAAGRARTHIVVGDTVIAVLEHDAALDRTPDVVSFVAGATASNLVAEAHARDAEARLTAARRSLGRLVVIDADTRRQLSHDLRAGALADLHSAADALRCGASVGEVIGRLKSATSSLRNVSHGAIPADLDTGGLVGVFGVASGAPTRRLAPVVEATACLVAGESGIARFVDRGSMIDVMLTGASPDVGCIDRVEALGGTVDRTTDGWVVTLPTGEFST